MEKINTGCYSFCVFWDGLEFCMQWFGYFMLFLVLEEVVQFCCVKQFPLWVSCDSGHGAGIETYRTSDVSWEFSVKFDRPCPSVPSWHGMVANTDTLVRIKRAYESHRHFVSSAVSDGFSRKHNIRRKRIVFLPITCVRVSLADPWAFCGVFKLPLSTGFQKTAKRVFPGQRHESSCQG